MQMTDPDELARHTAPHRTVQNFVLNVRIGATTPWGITIKRGV
jgi:hypothetical protein